MIKRYKQFNEELSSDKINTIRSIYNELIDDHESGESGIVGWTNHSRQEIRFQQLIKYIQKGDYILDYGCGVGDFYPFAKKLGAIYQGIDINPNMIENAKIKYPDAKFYSMDSAFEFEKYDYDWFIASGVFSNYMTVNEMISIIKPAFEKAKKGLAVNFLHYAYASEKDVYLRGYNPNKLFKLLKQNISSDIEIIDNYLPKEDFTIIFRK